MFKHPTAFEGLAAAIAEHPECFELLRDEGLLRVYRIHRERLRERVAQSQEPSDHDPL